MENLYKIELTIIDLLRIFPRQNQPYLDPSVVTYVIQVVIGVVITVGSIVLIYWRKAKQNVAKKLGIDEEVKKEIEDDVIIYSSQENQDEVDG